MQSNECRCLVFWASCWLAPGCADESPNRDVGQNKRARRGRSRAGRKVGWFDGTWRRCKRARPRRSLPTHRIQDSWRRRDAECRPGGHNEVARRAHFTGRVVCPDPAPGHAFYPRLSLSHTSATAAGLGRIIAYSHSLLPHSSGDLAQLFLGQLRRFLLDEFLFIFSFWRFDWFAHGLAPSVGTVAARSMLPACLLRRERRFKIATRGQEKLNTCPDRQRKRSAPCG